MDPAVIKWFQDHLPAMDSFDKLANEHGQNIEAALAPEGYGFDGCVVIRYSVSREPIGTIHPDGQVELV